MTAVRVIRYTTSPEQADVNEQLVREVFAELADSRPQGLRYATFRLHDQVSFMHIALLDGEDNPLDDSVAFAAFQSGIGARCSTPPTVAGAELVGSYRFLGDQGEPT